jgi:hypothetical protein
MESPFQVSITSPAELVLLRAQRFLGAISSPLVWWT